MERRAKPSLRRSARYCSTRACRLARALMPGLGPWQRHGCRVRVIEYTLTNSATSVQDSYRLVTNILEPQAAPALELAALYHERCEIEGVFDEIKTHMRSTSTVLRSEISPLVEQESWALLLAHFAVRQLIDQSSLSATACRLCDTSAKQHPPCQQIGSFACSRW